MGNLRVILLCFWATFGVACDGEEPLELGRPDATQYATDTGVTIGLDFGRVDAAVFVPPEVCPDPMMFAEDVMIHVRTCSGGACHSGAPNNDNLQFECDDLASGAPIRVVEYMNEVLRLIDFDHFEDSLLLTYHPDRGDPGKTLRDGRRQALFDWLNDAVNGCEEPDAGLPDAGPISANFPCAAQVDAERYGTPESRDSWSEEGGIHAMLVGESEGRTGLCASAECHGVANAGGGLWFASHTQPGAIDCNLQVIEPYIDRDNVDLSDILVRPLGEDPIRPGDFRHGGATVFQGRDENFVRLRNWIIESNAP